MAAGAREPAQERYHPAEIGAGQEMRQATAGAADLQQQHLPARPQHPGELGEGATEAGGVAQRVAHGQELELRVRERQGLHRALDQTQPAMAASDAQHPGAKIERGDAAQGSDQG